MEGFPTLNLQSKSLQFWLLSIPVVYLALVVFFRLLDPWKGKTSKKGSSLSDVMAFEIISLLVCAYLGIVGIIGWFQLNKSWDYSFYEQNKFYTHSQWVEDYLLIPMFCYQFWNTMICILWAEQRQSLMIGHHVFTASLGYFALHPFLHYYAVFFFGIAEVTNIPLTFVEIFDHFPDLRERAPLFNEFCRIGFAVSFILIRMIAWPIISYDFWLGLIDLLRAEQAHSRLVVWVYLVANTFLSGLQLLWGSTIISLLVKMIVGSDNSDNKMQLTDNDSKKDK